MDHPQAIGGRSNGSDAFLGDSLRYINELCFWSVRFIVHPWQASES